MSNSINKNILKVLFGLLLMLIISGCGPVVTDNNWSLAKGETRTGTLVLSSTNAVIDSNSHVIGSVVMLCCNLIVNGEIDGNLLVVSGNVQLGSHARVNGNVSFITGNEDAKMGAFITGTTWHLGQ